MSRSSLRWTVLIALLAIGGTVLVLAFLLSIATNNRVLYERHYEWLLWVNIGVAASLGSSSSKNSFSVKENIFATIRLGNDATSVLNSRTVPLK